MSKLPSTAAHDKTFSDGVPDIPEKNVQLMVKVGV